MNLTEFHDLVKTEANKGARLDGAIPLRTKLAVQRLERRYTMKHMERFVVLSLDPNVPEPRAVAFPQNGMKGVNFLRWYSDRWGRWVDLTQVDPKQIERPRNGRPHHYWFDGLSYIWFDNAVEEPLDLEFSFNEYSAWPPQNGTHWILDNAVDCLLAETMILLSTVAREPKWKDYYGDMLRTAEVDLFRSDNELRNTDRDYVMG